tara:strand:+ start:623 stop:823 length:201 start_codon:yes stop_codon:yes gene_type:complete
MIKNRTWELSWFIWTNGKGVKTKSVLKTVNPADYVSRECEKYELKHEIYSEYNLHSQKIVLIKEVK